MEQCGHYTADRTVGWGRKATYYSAAGGPKADEARVVIRCSRTSIRAHAQAFLRASAEQQTAVSSGCRRIAPILDFGISQQGRPYHVSPEYETSLAECIEAKNKFDAESLKTIVSGTLRALTELRDKCRRAHGNLTAGNILLDPSGEIFLTDLLPFAREASHAEDLRALGTILYQAVRKSLHVGFLTPPLDHSPEWTASLEDDADDWRELTNRLLSAQKHNDHQALAQASKDLKSLDSLAEKAAPTPSSAIHGSQGKPSVVSRAPVKRKRGKAIAAVVLIGVCGAAGFGVWKYTRPKPVVIVEVKKPVIGIEDLKKAVPPTAAASLGEGKYILDYIQASTSPTEMANHLRGWVTTEKLAKVEQDWRGRPANPWGKLADLLATKATLDSSWDELDETQQAETLNEALKDLGRTGTLLSQAQNLDFRWSKTKQAIDRVKALAIAGLPDFNAWAEDGLGKSPTLDAAVQQALTAEKALNELADAGIRVKPRLRIESFKTAAQAMPSPSADPTAPPWPKLWQTKLEASIRPDDAVMAKWNETFSRIDTLIGLRPQSERKKLRDDLAALRTASDTVLDADQATITDGLSKLQMGIRDPLVDLDAAYRLLFARFTAALDRAPNTTAGLAEAARFKTDSTALLAKPEFVDSVSALLANYKKTDRFTGLYNDLDAASKAPSKPVYTFPGATGAWTLVSEAPKSATYVFRGRRGGQSGPITFHELAGQNSAMASAETSLALAKLADVPLDTPGVGPLGYRESGRPNRDRWLWLAAENWAKAVIARRAGNPDAILPRDTDVEGCPVTWLTLSKASQIATALGGRLPKRTEWDAALQAFPPTTARLQFTTFAGAKKAVQDIFSVNSIGTIPLNVNGFPYPAAGGGAEFRGAVDDQRLLWLGPATNNAGKIVDLIGNAAEWISDGPAGPFFVAGGSCVTPRESPVTRPLPATAGTPYFDVTFRLVVNVAPGSENAGVDAMRIVVKQEADALNAIPKLGAPQ